MDIVEVCGNDSPSTSLLSYVALVDDDTHNIISILFSFNSIEESVQVLSCLYHRIMN